MDNFKMIENINYWQEKYEESQNAVQYWRELYFELKKELALQILEHQVDQRELEHQAMKGYEQAFQLMQDLHRIIEKLESENKELKS